MRKLLVLAAVIAALVPAGGPARSDAKAAPTLKVRGRPRAPGQ